MPILSIQIEGGQILMAVSNAVTAATFEAAERARDLIESELLAFEFKGEGKGPHWKDNLHVDMSASLTDIEIVAASDVPHAIILEEGARPHFVGPKNVKALMWMSGGQGLLDFDPASGLVGEKAFSKGHMVSGVPNPPRPMAKTAAKVEPIITDMFNTAIASAIGNAPLRGSIPSSILGGISVSRVRTRGAGTVLRLRGAGGRFIRGIGR